MVKENQLRILVVDDESEIRRFLRATLKAHDHIVTEADTGLKALAEVKTNEPDLIILDLGLPDVDGVEVTRQVRKMSQIPIIILSVRNRESDKIQALDAGADDYLTKPFGVGELLARMRVVMRRVNPTAPEQVYIIQDLCVDLERHLVTRSGVDIQLTPTEFALLTVLIQNAGKVVTHRKIIHKVWGTSFDDESRLLRVNISNLRRKIEPNINSPMFIMTELGIGYRFKEA